MAQQPGGAPDTGWSAIRPVLVALLLAADALAVVTLAVVHRKGWVPPFIGFGIVLVGLIWLEIWAVRHRHDDD